MLRANKASDVNSRSDATTIHLYGFRIRQQQRQRWCNNDSERERERERESCTQILHNAEKATSLQYKIGIKSWIRRLHWRKDVWTLIIFILGFIETELLFSDSRHRWERVPYASISDLSLSNANTVNELLGLLYLTGTQRSLYRESDGKENVLVLYSYTRQLQLKIWTRQRWTWNFIVSTTQWTWINHLPIKKKTNKQELHSSTMHTTCLLTVSPSMLCAGEVSLPGGLLAGGSALPGGVCLARGGLPCQGVGLLARGVCLARGVFLAGGWYPSMHWGRIPPSWTESQTSVKI